MTIQAFCNPVTGWTTTSLYPQLHQPPEAPSRICKTLYYTGLSLKIFALAIPALLTDLGRFIYNSCCCCLARRHIAAPLAPPSPPQASVSSPQEPQFSTFTQQFREKSTVAGVQIADIFYEFYQQTVLDGPELQIFWENAPKQDISFIMYETVPELCWTFHHRNGAQRTIRAIENKLYIKSTSNDITPSGIAFHDAQSLLKFLATYIK